MAQPSRPVRRLSARAASAVAFAWLCLTLPAIPAGAAADETSPVWNHNPDSAIGPPRWGDIGYPACAAGTSQSPVDIRTGAVVRRPGPPLKVSYDESELAIENTGHVIEVPVPEDVQDILRIGGDTYRLVQYHFHAPAEHTVNGRRADVEAHFVHQGAGGATAVMAVFFTIGPHPNRLLDTILRHAPLEAHEEEIRGEADPGRLVPGLRRHEPSKGDVRGFFSYDGSLTTPACTEGVRWFVLADGGQVSRTAVDRLHHVIARFPDYGGFRNNNRPVQPLNGRTIQFRGDAPARATQYPNSS
jgi:carbonic anhydrase